MQETLARPLNVDSAGVISKSLEAALEIERSRLLGTYVHETVAEFGRLLQEKAVRTTGDGKRGFSDPSYAAPLRNLYLLTQGPKEKVTTEDVVGYWDTVAQRFLSFDGRVSPEHKSELVKLCADIHHFLSDELRNQEEIGHRGWWH